MQKKKVKTKRIFSSRRTRMMALLVSVVLPVLLVAYNEFMNVRPQLHVKSEWIFVDTLIQNSDFLLAVLFLVVSAAPFYLIFDKKRAQARDLVPIALMSALCVVGRAAFSIVPMPNFKPVSAIIIITGVAFGPEAGYLTGALAGFLSNFLFGQGPWTPWQMFSWGLIGFVAGVCYKAGLFGKLGCETADEKGKRRKPVVLCVFGFCCGMVYGWILDLYHIVGYVDPITWQTIAVTYASSFFYDVSHGVCTALVLWFAAEPWVRKLLRIKRKFGLSGESQYYEMPPADS